TSDPIVELVGGTTVALVSSLNPSTFGQSVTITATVAADAAGSSIPTGSVTFMDGKQTLATISLDTSAGASLSTDSLTRGTRAITAVYGGAPDFTVSTSNELDQVVNAITTTAMLIPSASHGTLGESVSFTATVTSAAGTPAGSVTFKDGSVVLATLGLD